MSAIDPKRTFEVTVTASADQSRQRYVLESPLVRWLFLKRPGLCPLAFLNAELNAILVGSPEKERAGLVRAQTASHLFRLRSAARTRLRALAA